MKPVCVPWQDKEARKIHPHTLALIGAEACMEMLALARDLRSGAVPPENYDQTRYLPAWSCGSPCCIAGHLKLRASSETYDNIVDAWIVSRNCGIIDLFSANRPSDPQLAANAIERFVFDGSETPWESP